MSGTPNCFFAGNSVPVCSGLSCPAQAPPTPAPPVRSVPLWEQTVPLLVCAVGLMFLGFVAALYCLRRKSAHIEQRIARRIQCRLSILNPGITLNVMGHNPGANEEPDDQPQIGRDKEGLLSKKT